MKLRVTTVVTVQETDEWTLDLPDDIAREVLKFPSTVDADEILLEYAVMERDNIDSELTSSYEIIGVKKEGD